MWKEHSRMMPRFLASSAGNLTLAAARVKKREQVGGKWEHEPRLPDGETEVLVEHPSRRGS